GGCAEVTSRYALRGMACAGDPIKKGGFMKRTGIALAVVLAACASTPQVSELRSGVRTATFIQLGTEPLTYKLGVVDTGSFWSSYGGGGSGGAGVVVAGREGAGGRPRGAAG